jgi:hypothetical protein
MRHFPRGEPVEREGMGARCRELLALGLGCAASTMATKGSAAAAVSQAATELLSEPRASEHQAGSHTGMCEGRTVRRVLCASATSRVVQLSMAIVVVLAALARARCSLRSATVSPRYCTGKGRREWHT